MKSIIQYIIGKIGKLPAMRRTELFRHLSQVFLAVSLILFVKTNYPTFELAGKILVGLLSFLDLVCHFLLKVYPANPGTNLFSDTEMLECNIPKCVDYALLPGGNGRLELHPITFDTAMFTFPEDERSIKVSVLNDLAGAKYISWNTAFEKKKRRNSSHMRKDKRSILQAKHSAGLIEGHVHAVQVNDTTEAQILDGIIRFDEFPQSSICNDLNCSALVFLAVAFGTKNNQKCDPALIYRCIVYHLSILIKNKESINLIFQSPNKRCTRRLMAYGFSKAPKKSADGFDMFVIEVVNMALYPQVVSMAMRA